MTFGVVREGFRWNCELDFNYIWSLIFCVQDNTYNNIYVFFLKKKKIQNKVCVCIYIINQNQNTILNFESESFYLKFTSFYCHPADGLKADKYIKIYIYMCVKVAVIA